jgi:integrase
MGLRFSESLSLQVGDIDGQRKQVHIRCGKGRKDRFVPLPDLTYHALRALWCKHRNPCWLFPNTVGAPERIRTAKTHYRGATTPHPKKDICIYKDPPKFRRARPTTG